MKNTDFELNVIKLGIHTFQLQKGDRFESNGSYFNYIPFAPENKGKGKYRQYRGRSNDISAKKYEKDVLRADNIKLIKDEPLSEENPEKWRMKVWEVQYAYTVEKPDHEKLMILHISMGGTYGFGAKNWEYKAEEMPVKRVTNELIFLEKCNPITYHSKIEKKELDIVRTHHSVHYILCYMDDKYQENEQKLFKYVEDLQNSKIQTGHDIVKRETENLSKFQSLKKQWGYL